MTERSPAEAIFFAALEKGTDDERVAYVNFQFFFHVVLFPFLIDATSAKKSAINRSTVENVYGISLLP